MSLSGCVCLGLHHVLFSLLVPCSAVGTAAVETPTNRFSWLATIMNMITQQRGKVFTV